MLELIRKMEKCLKDARTKGGQALIVSSIRDIQELVDGLKQTDAFRLEAAKIAGKLDLANGKILLARGSMKAIKETVIKRSFSTDSCLRCLVVKKIDVVLETMDVVR